MTAIRRICLLGAGLAALAITTQAAAGGFATVQLSSTPGGARAGEPWNVDLTVLRHGRTPLNGLAPSITIVRGGESRSVSAAPAGRPGVYHAEVVFPSAGTWSWRIWDGFSQTHTYAPVEVAPAGGSAGLGSLGWGVWIAGLLGGAALAVGAAVLAASMRRRPPSPA